MNSCKNLKNLTLLKILNNRVRKAIYSSKVLSWLVKSRCGRVFITIWFAKNIIIYWGVIRLGQSELAGCKETLQILYKVVTQVVSPI